MTSAKRNTTSRRDQDPYLTREANKYDHPIPSREIILETLQDNAAPLRFDELVSALEVTEDETEAFTRRLKAMERDGQLVRNRRSGYCVVNKRDLVAGRVIGHADGFGFLRPDEGGEDLFLSGRQMKRLWHDDRIVAQVTGVDRRGRREGAVVEILERGVRHVVGRLHIDAGVSVLVPDNKRYHHEVLIPTDALGSAGDRQMVVAEITEQPQHWKQPVGRITEVLGDHMAKGMETEVALRAFDIPSAWPDELLAEISDLDGEVPEQAKEGRVDLRHLPLVTIDGADARDFDDAVLCQRTPKGWKLYVCIADVSAYVEPGTALDAEAYKRGTSVYFPDRVVPMLPEVLSNGLCSLNPQVDRLCMTAELFINDAGETYRSRFYPAVMRSHARLIYDDVSDMLSGQARQLIAEHAELLPHLRELRSLFEVLLAARQQRGAIEFDTTETRFLFGEAGKISEVVPLQRNIAHRIIEECMLAANVAAARFLLRRRIPALYRVHESPSAEKLLDLHKFLGELGLKLGGGLEPTAKDYADLLHRVEGRADAHMIQTVLLRSMMQAVYSADNNGHFGLAYDAYTHFTSPIRRYPDLLVHRAIRHLWAGGKPKDFAYGVAHCRTLGEHCSMAERRADEATRDVADVLKCEYMLDKVGETFTGLIVTVTGFGVFVELDDIFITGLVHITALDYDFFHFDPIGHRLVGERTGRAYRLGDAIEVTVAAVNLDDRKIDLVLSDAVKIGKGDKAGKPAAKGGKSAKGSKSGKKAKRAKATEGEPPQEPAVPEPVADAAVDASAPEQATDTSAAEPVAAPDAAASPKAGQSRSSRRRRRKAKAKAEAGAESEDGQA